jgi:hypothetical protein
MPARTWLRGKNPTVDGGGPSWPLIGEGHKKAVSITARATVRPAQREFVCLRLISTSIRVQPQGLFVAPSLKLPVRSFFLMVSAGDQAGRRRAELKAGDWKLKAVFPSG